MDIWSVSGGCPAAVMAYGGRIFKDLGASQRAPMPRFSTLFAPIRQSLLERDDPFRVLALCVSVHGLREEA